MGNSNEKQGHFLSHQPCPKCGSKDNLATYSDGHSYCFGCGYYIKGNLSDTFRKSSRNFCQSTSQVFDTSTWTPTIPTKAAQWISKYQLTASEIDLLDLYWDEYQGLLIFPIKKDQKLIGYIGRRFQGTGSKYLIRGEKKQFNSVYGAGTPLVFVEDLISAIKVARITSALPLFGTSLSTIPKGYSSYCLWLDKDKQISSLQQCKKWRQFGIDIKPIITDLDPKEYNTTQLKEILKNETSL